MKYEVILKVKHSSSSCYEQAGKITVPAEHLNTQFDEYKKKVKKMNVYDFVILVNELNDDGDFVRCVL